MQNTTHWQGITALPIKNIIRKEKPDSVLPTLGGQTGLNLACELAESGFFIDAENESDIFFEMDRAYREAVRALKKKSDKYRIYL